MLLSFLILLFTMVSCTKTGCTNPDATNYNKRAQEDNGSCIYPEWRDEMIGEYAVENININYSNDTVYFSDTISIEKGDMYNTLKIDGVTFNVEFKANTINFTRNDKHGSTSSHGHGSIKENEIEYYIQDFSPWSSLIVRNFTCNGYKIN